MNVDWIDKKYISILGLRLKGFQWKSSNLACCRCPICLDSKTNDHKTRGYFILKNDHYYFYCHNCGYASGIPRLLKRVDHNLYSQYNLELLESKDRVEHVTEANNRIIFKTSDEYTDSLKKLKKISQLNVDHPAKVYIDKRRIPTPYHSLLRWCPNFMEWTNTIIPKFDKKAMRYDEGRIIIPFFDYNNKFFAYTGRSILDNSVRYILIVLDNSVPVIYGLNSITLKQPVIAVEGPFDSMFLENCVAFVGGNFNSLTSVGEHDKFVICFDNEPRSSDTRKKINGAIEAGYPVVIWPSWVGPKDINEMILADLDPQKIIRENTFSGLEAKIRLEQWSKM